MKPHAPILAPLALIALLALGSCGGGGGGGDGSTAPPSQELGVFTGFKDTGNLDWQTAGGGEGGGVGDGGADGDGGVGAGGDFGQFRGANICVYLDNGTQLGCALTDDVKGMVTIKPGRDYRGGLRIELTGTPSATYYEEGRNTYVPFPADRKIRVWVPSIQRNVGITPFTEAAYRLLTEGSAPESVGSLNATKAQIAAANERVRQALNEHFPAVLQVDDIARLPFIKSQSLPAGSMRTDPRGRYGLVNGAFSKQASFHNGDTATPTLDMTRQLAEDLLDGRLDGRNGNAPAAPAHARTYDPNTLGGELSSALAEQAARFGAQEALDALPKLLNFGNVRYEGYLFDGSISKAGTANSTVAGWVAENTKGFTTGQQFDRLPGQRALALFSNNGHGGGFYKADANGPRHKVYAIGDNVNGELGTGSVGSTNARAVEITLPGAPSHIVGGFAHTLARMADGTVWAWGDNSFGQLGQNNAALANSLTPRQVTLPVAAVAVAAANTTSFALGVDGKVYAWGANGGFGLLGNGSADGVALAPVEVAGLSEIVQISARDNDVVVLRRDNTVWHWGSHPADANAFVPGNPAAPYLGGTRTPTQINGLPAGVAVRKVLTEQGLFAALLANGHVYTWGVHFDITAGQVLRTPAQMNATRMLGLPPIRDMMPGGFQGYGTRAFDRLTGMGVDYSGGMWKIRGRVGEVYDPDTEASRGAQRRPQNQGPRVDCEACHTFLDQSLTDIKASSRQPTSGAPECQPPISVHRGLTDTLIHAETDCVQCHNPSRLNYPASTPSGNIPFAANGGWPDCVKPANLPGRSSPAPSVFTNSCQVPPNHVFTPPGTVCASCHNTIIARPLNDPSLACAQPKSSELPTIAKTAAISGAFNDSGTAIAGGGLTNDRTPELRGTLSAALAAGESLAIQRDGAVVGSAAVSGTAWTFVDTAPDGSHRYTARVVRAAEFGATSNALAIVVDATPPSVAATVANFTDDALGTVAPGGFISDTTPTLNGVLGSSIGSDESVQVLRDGAVAGTAVVGGTSWAFNEPAALSLGVHAYQARVVDAAGNLGPLSGAAQITLVGGLPTVTITQALNDATNQPIANGGTTNDTTPVLSGTLSAPLTAGQVLIVLRDGVARGNGTVGGGGTSWTFTDPGSANGIFAYTARVDAGAVQGAPSAAYTLTVDTVVPTQRADVASIADDVNGVLAGTNPTTPDTTPTVNGTITTPLTAGDLVQVLRNGAVVATLPSFGGTAWSYTEPTPITITPPATQVTLTYAARVIDGAGQLGPTNGATRQVTVAPGSVPLQGASTTITAVAGQAVGAGGAVVNSVYSTAPTLGGTIARALLADEVIAIYRNTVSPVVPASRGGTAALAGTISAAALGAATTWNFTSAALAAGTTYYFSANIEKAANAAIYGAPSATSGVPIVTAPSIAVTGIFDDAGIAVTNNNTTDSTPRISGTLGRTLVAGETLQLRRTLGGTTTNIPVVPSGTSWTYTELAALAVGTYSYALRTLDGAAVGSTQTAPVTVNVIAALPSVATIGGPVANDGWVASTAPTISGTLGAVLPSGASVRVYRAFGANLCTTLGSAACPLVGTVGTVGFAAWAFTDSNATQGQRRYRVRVENGAAYGATSAEYRLNVDTVAPTQTFGTLTATTSVMPNTTVTGAVPNGNGIASGGRTNDNSPTLRIPLNSALGSGETLRIKRNGVTVISSTLGTSCGSNCFLVDLPSTETLTNNEGGVALSLTAPSTAGLPTAARAYTVVVVDLAGNESAASAAFNISFGYHDCDLARANATYGAYNGGAAHPAWTGLTCSSCHTASSATAPTPAGTMVAVPAGISFPTAPTTSYWCRRP